MVLKQHPVIAHSSVCHKSGWLSLNLYLESLQDWNQDIGWAGRYIDIIFQVPSVSGKLFICVCKIAVPSPFLTQPMDRQFLPCVFPVTPKLVPSRSAAGFFSWIFSWFQSVQLCLLQPMEMHFKATSGGFKFHLRGYRDTVQHSRDLVNLKKTEMCAMEEIRSQIW